MCANYLTANNADALWVVRDHVRFMGDILEKNISALEVMVPPGSGTPPHSHESAEIFRVLEGEVTFGLFDTMPPRQIVAGPGSVITIAPGEPHNYVNTSDRPAEMFVVIEHDMTRFFRDLGRREAPEQAPPSAAEIEEVVRACSRHGITVHG